MLKRDQDTARPRVLHPPQAGVRPVRQKNDVLGMPALDLGLARLHALKRWACKAVAQQRVCGDVKRPALHAYQRENGCACSRQREIYEVPGRRPCRERHERDPPGDERRRQDRQKVDDSALRYPARVEAHPIDAIDASLKVKHPSIGTDLHQPDPNRDLTVSRSRLTPAGVASNTDTMPTANTPAASLKSRRNAR